MEENTPNNVLITGASGFVGSALQEFLTDAGYKVYALDRKDPSAPFYFDQQEKAIRLSEDIPLHAVINLAGASIADGRWTKQRKEEIWNSRVETTELLCAALAELAHPPKVLVSASAIGFYGRDCYEPADELSSAGDDFLAKLSVAWEAATQSTVSVGMRVVHLRFSLVLDRSGGVIKNLIAPLGLAVVGRLGSGNHLQSWISLDDALSVTLKCIENEEFSGVLNAVAPEVVTNREFATTMSQALNRPQLPPMPASIVRLMFGEVADAALLASANIKSIRMAELGITLHHPTLRSALEATANS